MRTCTSSSRWVVKGRVYIESIRQYSPIFSISIFSIHILAHSCRRLFYWWLHTQAASFGNNHSNGRCILESQTKSNSIFSCKYICTTWKRKMRVPHAMAKLRIFSSHFLKGNFNHIYNILINKYAYVNHLRHNFFCIEGTISCLVHTFRIRSAAAVRSASALNTFWKVKIF